MISFSFSKNNTLHKKNSRSHGLYFPLCHGLISGLLESALCSSIFSEAQALEEAAAQVWASSF